MCLLGGIGGEMLAGEQMGGADILQHHLVINGVIASNANVSSAIIWQRQPHQSAAKATGRQARRK